MRRIRSFVLTSVLLIVRIPFLFGQTGALSGTITDLKTGEAIPGASVTIDGTAFGINTDLDGKYIIESIPEGHYTIVCRYLSYDTKVVNDFLVVTGKENKLDIKLNPSNLELKEVTVAANKTTHTENAVINEIKKSNVLLSGVSSQQIAKSQDRDAAEVVKRIPGVTVVENRFIVVRGLNERYNNVWLNDAGAPSSETDKRAFSFDILPSGLIDRVLVYKTPSAELPGDFAGGMVKIYTKSIPDEASLVVNYQNSMRQSSTFQPFYSTEKSKTDYLGYDKGFRSLPNEVPDSLSKNDPGIKTITQSFKNTWGLSKTSSAPDNRFSVYYLQPVKIKNSQFSNVTGVNYSNVNSVIKKHRQDWDSTAQVNDYTDTVCTSLVKTTALENLSFKHGNTKIEFKNLINLMGQNQSTIRNSNFLDGPNEKIYVEGYQSKSVWSSQLSGSHASESEARHYFWTIGYASINKEDPDLRRIKYTKARPLADSMYSAAVANVVDPVNGGGRLYTSLNEKIYSFNQNYKQKVTIKNYSFEINAGNYVEYKDRSFKARIFGYTIKPGAFAQTIKRLPIDSIFDDVNIGLQPDSTKGFLMDEITSASDKYKAQNELIATYISFNVPIAKRINILTGLRHEYNEQSLQSFVNLDSVHPKIVTRFILPSINASFNFNDRSLIRGAYGKTLNRPEFREWSPFYFYDFELGAGTYGSLFPTVLFPKGNVLKIAEVQNFDLRYELYPNNNEMFHFGLFYKSFLNPIQQVILPSGGSDSKAFTFINAKSAYSTGIEIDTRKNLYLIFNENPELKFLNRLSVVGNISLIKSSMDLGSLSPDTAVLNIKVVHKPVITSLQGQSPYVVNTGLYYQNDSTGLDITLLYNVIGPRVFLVGTLDIPNVGEMPRHTLDFIITKTFYKRVSVNFSVQDIFNNPVLLIQDTNRNGKFDPDGGDKEVLSYKKGSYFSFGVKVKI